MRPLVYTELDVNKLEVCQKCKLITSCTDLSFLLCRVNIGILKDILKFLTHSVLVVWWHQFILKMTSSSKKDEVSVNFKWSVQRMYFCSLHNSLYNLAENLSFTSILRWHENFTIYTQWNVMNHISKCGWRIDLLSQVFKKMFTLKKNWNWAKNTFTLLTFRSGAIRQSATLR